METTSWWHARVVPGVFAFSGGALGGGWEGV